MEEFESEVGQPEIRFGERQRRLAGVEHIGAIEAIAAGGIRPVFHAEHGQIVGAVRRFVNTRPIRLSGNDA